MTWFKVDDSFYSHPKVVQLSLSARGLWVTAGSWCADHETDGFVPDAMIRVFGAKKRTADELESATLWKKVDGGWKFHDWEKYQPTAGDLDKKREKTREKLRSWRSRNQVTNHGGNGVTNEVSNAAPDPTRPDPLREERARAREAPDLRAVEPDTAWIRLGRLYQQLHDSEQEGSRNPRPYDEQRITSCDAPRFRKLHELTKAEAARSGVGERLVFGAAATAFLRDPKQREKGYVLEFFARDFHIYVDRTMEAAS